MNYNVNQRIGVKINDTLRSGYIESLDGFEAQIVLDDGARYTAQLEDLLMPEMPPDDGIMDPLFGNLRDKGVNSDRDFLFFLDFKHMSRMTIESSLRVWYSVRKEVTATLSVRSRIVKTISVLDEDFSGNQDNWKYAVGEAGFSFTGGELEADGFTVPALFVPKYAAYRWNSHGIEFTIKNLATGRITLGALIEGGVLFIDLRSGDYAELLYRDDVEGDTSLGQISLNGATIAPDDVITVLDHHWAVTIFKNGEILVGFGNLTPGKVKSSWGFWNDAAYNIDDFSLIGRAQQVSAHSLSVTYNVRTLPFTPPEKPVALIDKIRAYDSNLAV